jgi:LysM repeat protein
VKRFLSSREPKSLCSVRISLLLLSLLCLPGWGQIPDDPDTTQAPRALPAGPAAAQDAEASREKLLKAADNLDLIQSNAETTKVAVDGMKSDIAALQASNADLKQQLAALQAAFDKAEAERTKERQVLVDEVAQLVASRNASASRSSAKRHEDALAETTDVHAPDGVSAAGESAPETEIHHDATDTGTDLAPPADPVPPPKPQKGYYHTVESGETLTMICAAYRDQGVKVSVAQVKKANGLTGKSVLKVGQKLFIPKPGV